MYVCGLYFVVAWFGLAFWGRSKLFWAFFVLCFLCFILFCFSILKPPKWWFVSDKF